MRATRELRGLGVRELARAAGISEGFVVKIERGLTRGSADTHQRVANALGVAVETITFDASTHEPCTTCHGSGLVPKVGAVA